MEFNRFDVSTKELVWEDPAAWLRRLGIGPDAPCEVVDSDITTLTAAADKVIRVGGDDPFLVNIEFQSGRDPSLVDTLCYRQAALTHRHGLTVLTVLFLLRKGANSPGITGVRERRLPDGRVTSRYDYQVVRLWQESPEPYLNAEVGLLPLAPLTDIGEHELPGVVERMKKRINREPKQTADKHFMATCLLMGLRYSPELTFQLLEGALDMQESTTYRWILKEGEKKGKILGAREVLLRQGSKHFQAPAAEIIARIETFKSLARLEKLIDKAYDPNVQSWDELLGKA